MREEQITICGHGSSKPSTKNLKEYLTQRQSQVAKNGKPKGLVEVRRPIGMTKEMRKQFHDYYKTILGRNYYSQDKRQYVYSALNGLYYSDCSSSGMATLQKCGLKFSWLYNTAGIHTGVEFETVKAEIKDGHILNPEVLQVGDALLFVGEDSSRPLQIGHVEWVYETPDSLLDFEPGISNKHKVDPYRVKVTADALNVRKEPLTGEVFRVLHKDDKVKITKVCTVTKENGSKSDWGFVKSLQGWISLPYTKKVAQTDLYRTIVARTNFREEPFTGKIISVLPKNTELRVSKVLTIDGIHVALSKYNGKNGYFVIDYAAELVDKKSTKNNSKSGKKY